MFEYIYLSFKENNTQDTELNLNLISFNKSTNWNFSSILYLTIYVSLLIIGLLANSFVIYVYAMGKNPIRHTKYFFINLSISDIFILVLCIPVSINDVLNPNEWFFGKYYCKKISLFI